MRASSLATLILLIPLISTRAAAADLDQLLRRAAEARNAGDNEETLSLLRQAYQARPLPEILNNIGRTLETLGRYDEAAVAYRRVLADSSAKPALLELDRERLSALAPKLERAWLKVGAGPAAFLDGDPIATDREIEVPLGPHLLELAASDSGVLIFFTAFPSRRVDVARDPRDRLEVEAQLDLSGAPIQRLFLNDRLIQSKHTIALPAGTYRIRCETESGTQSKQIRIGEGRTLLLGSVLDPVLASATPPFVALELPSRPVIGPLLLGGAGVIAGGVGALFVVFAGRDRDRVRTAEMDGDVVVGLTMIEALQLEARANDRATAGLVAISAAGAFGIGALFWWLFGE